MNIKHCQIAREPLSAIFARSTETPRLLGLFLAIVSANCSLVLPGSAFAGVLASETISTSSTSAPYSYTITLNNIGTTNIGTLWFAWTDVPFDYDFLPSVPTVTSMPSGWVAPITHNAGFPGDGYGMEFYNLSGSPIAPGNSTTFEFTSPDSPATLAGNAFLPPNKVTTSFVYIGFPQTDPGYSFNGTVVTPEPSTLLLTAIAGCLGLLTWVRRRRAR